ncbi:MAG: radical SAM protein [Elusimicrobiota bacterium]|jgi:nitrogen fixation protein NifB|nr:radical SAM protein [Elusimicrobiota bacterium]
MGENDLLRHPCFNSQSSHNVGRIHLPVSPTCNISCRFCRREFDKVQNRPGVSFGILKKENVADTLQKAIALCPQINVIGIAGPGESLDGNNALDALEIAHRKYPFLIKCLSTNGLLLPSKVDDLVSRGVLTLTVTVNAVSPEILADIVAQISYEGKIIKGIEAAEILISNQLEGIRKAASAGLKVKVNTVLIPQINFSHIADIAQAVQKAGASIYNIIPLIPQGDFFNYAPPDCSMISVARQKAQKYIEIFYHCRHCRADACGIPSKNDFAKQLYNGIEMLPETFSHG